MKFLKKHYFIVEVIAFGKKHYVGGIAFHKHTSLACVLFYDTVFQSFYALQFHCGNAVYSLTFNSAFEVQRQ